MPLKKEEKKKTSKKKLAEAKFSNSRKQEIWFMMKSLKSLPLGCRMKNWHGLNILYWTVSRPLKQYNLKAYVTILLVDFLRKYIADLWSQSLPT